MFFKDNQRMFFRDEPSDLLYPFHENCGNCRFFKDPECKIKAGPLELRLETDWCADHKWTPEQWSRL